MRSVFTALAFLVILLAVMPAVKRSLYSVQKGRESASQRVDGRPGIEP
jgi:hypothetical protein